MSTTPRWYLDHNATTPVDPRVLACFVEVESSCPGNPSSVHTQGRRARALVEDARHTIARCLAVDDEEVVFTSGGTEANNMVVLGLGDLALPVCASAAEHSSVLEPARQRGLRELQVDVVGRTRFDTTASDASAIAIVCAVQAQSELGTLNDLATARVFADARGAALHVDASQALGRVPLAPAITLCDTLTLAPHKAGGLKGIGVLVVRARAPKLTPPTLGGGQERGRRPGTVSPALAAAAALSVQLASEEQAARAVAMRSARDAFLATLAPAALIECLTPLEDSVPNTLMLHFASVRDGRTLLPALDLAGIDASHGAACSSGSPLPPLVLRALGRSDDDARRCVRFSFSQHTTRGSAQDAAQRVHDVLTRLQHSQSR